MNKTLRVCTLSTLILVAAAAGGAPLLGEPKVNIIGACVWLSMVMTGGE